jgi:hypothetical protein
MEHDEKPLPIDPKILGDYVSASWGHAIGQYKPSD